MTPPPPTPGKPPFDRLVTDHGARVLRVCRAVVGPVDADDVWSETFIAALGAYPELPADANLQAWLVTIAHRKAIDAVRARRRRPVPVAEPPDRAAPQSPRDGAAPVWEHVAALSERQRTAVIAHHVAAMPYREVAEIMNCSEAAARRAAADGIAALRRALTTGGTQ